MIIISHFENKISSPSFKKINRLALAPFLGGRNCRAETNNPFIEFFTVHRILPEKTPLKLIQAFMIDKKFNLMEKFIFKTLSLFEIGIKGGPPMYFIAKDSNNEKFIIDEQRVIKELFYLYSPSNKSPPFSPAEKTRRILKVFPTQKLSLQTIFLEIETYQEFFNEKCRFYQSPEDKKKNRKWPLLAFQALSLFSKKQTQYVFKNIELKEKIIQLQVNKKSLAFLMLNSSHLSIKNITLEKIQ